ncbi:unnamed protein product [Tuber melanosporum]|uniref:(Perigord truffle) hypothetical protein n=1 Tax=Tuber melanosporum (strain Mel28) TaxID=656061 RepID=D5GMW3_TUBMM|nr:uncharacterized protein GSTUM_00010965001 [Tuber melanosporum]CAZ85856.1 unnamed protein product [Tuber melanosporum]
MRIIATGERQQNRDVFSVSFCLLVSFSIFFPFFSWLSFPFGSGANGMGYLLLCFIYPFAAWNNGKWLFNLYKIEYKQGISCIRLAADLTRDLNR